MCLWMRSLLYGVLGHPVWMFPQKKWPHEGASFSLSLTPGDNHFLSFFKIKSHKHLHTSFFWFSGFPSTAKHHLQSAPAAGEQGARHWAKREPVQEKWWVSELASPQCPTGHECANHHVIKSLNTIAVWTDRLINRRIAAVWWQQYDVSSCFLSAV